MTTVPSSRWTPFRIGSERAILPLLFQIQQYSHRIYHLPQLQGKTWVRPQLRETSQANLFSYFHRRWIDVECHVKTQACSRPAPTDGKTKQSKKRWYEYYYTSTSDTNGRRCKLKQQYTNSVYIARLLPCVKYLVLIARKPTFWYVRVKYYFEVLSKTSTIHRRSRPWQTSASFRHPNDHGIIAKAVKKHEQDSRAADTAAHTSL